MAEALSRQRAAHALRHFILIGALWSIYGPGVFIASSVFTGYALSLGISESQIAFLAAGTGLMGATQAVTAYWTRRARDRRRLCFLIGAADICCASSIVFALLLPQALRFPFVAVLLFLAYTLGNTVNPMFANWMATVIPEDVRATYLARRMFVLTLVSVAYLFLVSRWLDLVEGPLRFVVVYALGWLTGLGGYVMVLLTPMPPVEPEEPAGYGRSILAPLKQRSFALLAAFMGMWTLAMAVASPFYSVFMLRYLNLSYTRIAVYSNLSLGAMLMGYRMFGALAERHGCKPIIKLLIVPAVLVPFMWAIAGPGTWPILVPVACALSGLAVSGIQVAASALLYKIVPAGKDNSLSFAILTSGTALGSFAGAMGGGFLKSLLGDQGWELFGHTLAPPQVVFLASAVIYLIPLLLTQLLREPEAQTAVGVLGQFRGNLVGLAYNYILYNLAREGRSRAVALRGMARSHSPLAVAKLAESLDDVSPEVRHEAALGLGEAKAKDAVPHLVERLTDAGSDIRPEAAEALGQIGDPAVVDPLRQAFEEGEPRLRASAAMALAEIGSPDARELLIQALGGPVDRASFAAVVDAAGRTGDLRVVARGLAGLPHFDSPVLRMQIINGVCRSLGERNHFYQLVSRRGLDRSALVEPMMKRIVRLLRRAPGLTPEQRAELSDEAQDVAGAVEHDRTAAMADHARLLADRVAAIPSSGDVALAGAAAIRAYVDQVPADRLADEGVVFVVVALTSLARHIGRTGRTQEHSP
jgi:predicted MFS family arabinose efflux permease